MLAIMVVFAEPCFRPSMDDGRWSMASSCQGRLVEMNTMIRSALASSLAPYMGSPLREPLLREEAPLNPQSPQEVIAPAGPHLRGRTLRPSSVTDALLLLER